MATNTSNSSGRSTSGQQERETILLTREGYEEKKARLHWLISERRQQVADYIHEAKEAGDVSESSAYEDAKNIQAMVEGEIQELQRIVDNAVIIEAPKHNGGKRTCSSAPRSTSRRRAAPRPSRSSAPSRRTPPPTSSRTQSPVGKALLGKRGRPCRRDHAEWHGCCLYHSRHPLTPLARTARICIQPASQMLAGVLMSRDSSARRPYFRVTAPSRVARPLAAVSVLCLYYKNLCSRDVPLPCPF